MLFNNQYLLPSPKIFYPLVYQNPWNFSKSLIWFNIVFTEAPVRTLRRNSTLSSCHLWKQNMNKGLQYWAVVEGEGGALPGSGRHERLEQAMGEVWTSAESQWRMRALCSDGRRSGQMRDGKREAPTHPHPSAYATSTAPSSYPGDHVRANGQTSEQPLCVYLSEGLSIVNSSIQVAAAPSGSNIPVSITASRAEHHSITHNTHSPITLSF